MNRFRPYAGTERFTVMEFVAAPGQFVNAGYEATTYEEANAYAGPDSDRRLARSAGEPG